MLILNSGRWPASLKFVFVLPLFALAVGCNANDQEMVLKISWRDGFFSQGFPTDLRNDDNRIDVGGFPRPLQLFSLTYTRQVEQYDFGYSPAMPLYMQFGSGLAMAEHIDTLNPTEFASELAPVQVIDIDPDSPDYGARYPLAVAMTTEADQYRPQNLLQVRPVGKPLRENTTYAMVVLRDFAGNAAEVEPNPELTALLEGRNPWSVNPLLLWTDAARARQVYAPLAEFIAAQDLAVGDVIGATVWTTGNPSRYLKNLVANVSQWQPVPADAWLLREETADYCVLESKWEAPVLQKGAIPFVTAGTIDFDDQSSPVIRRTRTAPIIVTIPKQTMPAAGFPVLHYHHGTGGLATQVFERGLTAADGSQSYLGSPAQVAAQRGWATTAMAGHLGADHQEQLRLLDTVLELIPGFTLNHTTYNFLNPKAMRDNFAQMLAERTLYRKLVMSLSLDDSLCAAAVSGSGEFHFDTGHQAVMGQSLGSMTASASAATDQGYSGLIATGAGNYGLGLALFYSLGESDVGALIENVYLNVEPGTVTSDLFHPVWALAELVLAPANISLLTSKWLQAPEQAPPAPHVMVVEGHYDEQVTLPMQRPYLISLGADFMNEELDVPESSQLLPDLQIAGYEQLFSPVAGNRDGRTVGVVRYEEDGIMTGHHVTFQYPAPQHQYGCFLEDLAQGLTPTIIVGSVLGSACR
ncbi:MAG: hypothetical protein D9N11_03690 [Ketobacter sp.]|nr:MAG: hypothetical protein D9N11_03690 [Ketobacter sp.]